MTERMNWEVRSYRSNPMRYAGIDTTRFLTQSAAEEHARELRRISGMFCVEVMDIRPAYFWLGAQAEAAHG